VRYFVNHGIEVRTENAALPINQLSQPVVSKLRSLPNVRLCADYGTGKGRYAPFLAEQADQLHLVDSLIQNRREQRFGPLYQTLEERYASDNAQHSISIKQFIENGPIYDRVALLNVLPVIPIPSISSAVLQRCCSALKEGGQLCVTVNYRNSEYTKSIRSDAARPYRDGHLVAGYRGHFFFRLMPPPCVDENLSALKFEIEEKLRIEGTMLYLARKL